MSWTSVTGAASYKVFRNGSQIGTPTSTSYGDSGLAAGTTYTYSVQACNSAGSCSSSTSASPVTTAAAAPAAPGSVSASVSGTSASVSWTAASGAASYKVFRNGSQIGTSTSTGYGDSGLAAGTTYTYSVQACNSAGTCSSSTSASPVTTAAATQAAPGSVSASVSGTSASVSWTAASGAASYKVFRNGAQIGTSTSTSYGDSGLAAGTTYTYSVQACNSAGSCSSSTSASPVTTAAATPAAPGSVSASVSGTSASVSWTAASGAASYKVFRNGAQIGTSTSTSYGDSGLAAGTTYTYSVQACNSAGSCSSSTSASPVTTAAATPAAPGSVSASASGTSASVSWTAASGAASYKVFRNGAQIGTSTSTSYGDSGLAAGTTYTYSVQACNSAGSCSSSTSASPVTTPAAAPAAPGSVSVSLIGSSTVVSWPAVSGAASYKVFRNGAQIGTPTSNSYSDYGLATATTYTYSVQACNSAGSCSASTSAAPVTTGGAALAPPSNVIATNEGGYARVSWTASPSPGVEWYDVRRNGLQNGYQPKGTSLEDPAVEVGSSYSYGVAACNLSGCSSYVGSSLITIGPWKPVTPANLSVVASGTVMAIRWDGVTGAASYTIQKTVGGVTSEITNLSGASHTDSSVTPGASHSYAIKACNVSGCSSYSASVSANANAAVPASPSNVIATNEGGYAKVSWTASPSPGVEWYDVRRNGLQNGYQPKGTSLEDPAVEVGSSYSYGVAACNLSGCSAYVGSSLITIGPWKPATPANLSVVASGTVMAIRWDGVTGAASYTIQKTVGGVISEITNLSGASHTDSSVTPGASHSYAIKACNVSGCSSYSASVSANANAAVPAPPTNATAKNEGGYVRVSWTASPSTGVEWYDVRRDGVPSGYQPKGTSLEDHAVSVGSSYSYGVAACNLSGCSSYIGTSSVTVTAPPPSAAPTGLSATMTDTSAALLWNGVNTATHYKIDRTPASAAFPTGAINTTAYVDSGLTPVTTYSYRVQACNEIGCSPWSSALSVTTKPLAPPLKPASLSAKQNAATVELSWTSVSNATSYKLKRLNGGSETQLADATTNAAVDRSVTVDIENIYQVQACNSAGCSAEWTTSDKVTVPHIPMPPTVVTGNVRKNLIIVTWTNNDNATSAKLSRNQVQLSTAATSPYSDANVVNGTVYTYSVSACNLTGCSAVVNSAPVTAGVVQAGTTTVEEFKYDVLGRLIKVKEDGTQKTEYQYDNAGNRKQVTE